MARKLTADQTADRDVARDRLRAAFPKGSTVSTVVRHVSSSGMQRAIVVLNPTGNDTEVENVSRQVARALEWSLASVLYGDGYALNVRNIA